MTKTKLEPLNERTKNDLIAQKLNVEEEIRLLERREIERALMETLPKLHDLNHSLTAIQNNLNIVWKRTQQIQSEVQHILGIEKDLQP